MPTEQWFFGSCALYGKDKTEKIKIKNTIKNTAKQQQTNKQTKKTCQQDSGCSALVTGVEKTEEND